MIDDRDSIRQLRDPEMLRLLARLAPRRGSGIDEVTISAPGERGVTLRAEDGDRLRRAAKRARAAAAHKAKGRAL